MFERASMALVLLVLFIIFFVVSSFLKKNMADKEKKENQDIIWQDCMHIGLVPVPWNCYRLVEHRLYINHGLFLCVEKEYFLCFVTDIELRISLLDRLCGIGSIILRTRDGDEESIVLKGIKKPKRIRDMLLNWVKIERKRRKEIMTGIRYGS